MPCGVVVSVFVVVVVVDGALAACAGVLPEFELGLDELPEFELVPAELDALELEAELLEPEYELLDAELPELVLTFAGVLVKPIPHTGHAPLPCDASRFSATAIC